MIDNEIDIYPQEKLNLEIFKQVAREQGVNVDTVRGTGVTREFIPEYMKGDICDRPDQNARSNTWGNNGGLEDDGIYPHFRPSNPVNPSNDDGALELPGESNYNSPSYSDETISNINKDDGNIFSKLFDFIGLGENSNNPGDTICESQFSSQQPSIEEVDRMRDKAEPKFSNAFSEFYRTDFRREHIDQYKAESMGVISILYEIAVKRAELVDKF